MIQFIKLYFYTTLIICLNINFAKSEIAFSFDKVNLISVMNLLSTEINRNISIEENVDAKISLIISHPISEKKIISTLQNSLMLNDLVLIEKENGDLLIKNNLNLKVDAPPCTFLHTTRNLRVDASPCTLPTSRNPNVDIPPCTLSARVVTLK